MIVKSNSEKNVVNNKNCIYKESILVTRKTRLQVRVFKDSDAMHKFLNKQTDNDWQPRPAIYGGVVLPVKSGTYAYAGGQWHNVKTLDPTVLAHV